MPYGSRSNPYIPGYGYARKARPDLRKRGGGPAPLPASHPAAVPSVESSGASTSSVRRSQASRRRVSPRSASPTLTSLASELLVGGLNDLLEPDPQSGHIDLHSNLSKALRGLMRDGNELDRRLAVAVKHPAKRIDVLGPKTLGNVTVDQVIKASQKGTLKANQRGKLTIPATRKTARTLKRTRKELRQATRPPHEVGGIQDRQIRRAIIKYAPRVDHLAQQRYGLSGEALLAKLIEGESGENMGAVSSASAKSITQFIPSTRADFVNRLGVDPWRSKGEAVLAATMHLDGKHGYSPGLEGYNPGGGQAYVDYILGQPAGAPVGAGKPADPAIQARLNQAKSQARALGIPTESRGGGLPQQGRSRRTPTIIKLGLIAQSQFGLRVSEHPYFDQVDPVHTAGSFHYTGQAIDVTGDPAKLAAFNKFVASRFGDQLAEMFYDPGINIDNGQPTGPIGGHGTHVHVAIDEPGTKAHGLAVSAYGLPAAQPVGYYGAGGSPEAAQQSAQRARQAVMADISAMSAPTAAHAALPIAYQQFQLGSGAEDQGLSELGGVIDSILSRRRL